MRGVTYTKSLFLKDKHSVRLGLKYTGVRLGVRYTGVRLGLRYTRGLGDMGDSSYLGIIFPTYALTLCIKTESGRRFLSEKPALTLGALLLRYNSSTDYKCKYHY